MRRYMYVMMEFDINYTIVLVSYKFKNITQFLIRFPTYIKQSLKKYMQKMHN